MMRRLSYLLPMLLIAVFSCTKEDRIQPWNGPGVELTLTTGEGLATRAGADGTKDGVDRYNENLIGWVDIFFYPGGATEKDATYHVRMNSGKRYNDVLRIEMTSEQVNSVIFPSTPEDIRNCKAVAFVNYPGTLVEDEEDLTGTSLPEIEALVVSTDFVSPEDHRQDYFMMSGEVDLTLWGRAQVLAASGEIPLSRYACKLTVGVDVDDEVLVGLEKWHPMITGMEMYLVNGVSDVCLSGEKSTDPTYVSYRSNSMTFAYQDYDDQIHYLFEKDGSYYQTYPTYMYPQHWVYGSTNSPDKEPYIKLVVPWMREADAEHNIKSTQRQSYYKIIIPDDRREEFRRRFVRNNWYHIDVRVGILGAETDDASVVINNGWVYIVYWQDKDVVIKEANIGNARYLSVEEDHYDLNNVASSVFRYTSSHPVYISDVRVTRRYYGESNSGDQYGGTIRTAVAGDPFYSAGEKYLEYSEAQRKALNGGEDWFTDSGTSILFQHALDNDYTKKSFDYSPYKISYTLVHDDRRDDPTYRKTVTVTQYPGIYIEHTPNTDPLTGAGGKPLHWGYVYIDNEQLTLAEYDRISNNDSNAEYRFDHLWRVVYYSSGGRDMYRINATVLPRNSEFVIGDPRQSMVDNLRSPDPAVNPYGYFHDALDVDGVTRSLQYYYPTENSDRTVNMIAPSYQISTKLSGIEHNGITFQKAKERCAAFQENGFPAGRWRLPTKGEIRFISQLSSLGFFEWQFGGDYWSANGPVYVDRNSGVVRDSDRNMDTGIALLRCVYDTWYWGNDQLPDPVYPDRPLLDKFRWGDKER